MLKLIFLPVHWNAFFVGLLFCFFCTLQRPRFLLPLYFIQSGLHSSGKIYKRPSNDLAFVLTHGFVWNLWLKIFLSFFFFFPYWKSKNYMSRNANMNLTSHVVMVLMEQLWCLLWRDGSAGVSACSVMDPYYHSVHSKNPFERLYLFKAGGYILNLVSV